MELVEKMTWENQAKRRSLEQMERENYLARKRERETAERKEAERWSWFVAGGAGAAALAYAGVHDLGSAFGCLAVLLLAIGSAVNNRG